MTVFIEKDEFAPEVSTLEINTNDVIGFSFTGYIIPCPDTLDKLIESQNLFDHFRVMTLMNNINIDSIVEKGDNYVMILDMYYYKDILVQLVNPETLNIKIVRNLKGFVADSYQTKEFIFPKTVRTFTFE